MAYLESLNLFNIVSLPFSSSTIRSNTMHVLTFCVLALSITAEHQISAEFPELNWFHSAVSIIEKAVTLYDEFSEDPLHLSVREKRLYDSLNNATRFIDRVETNIPQVTIARINELQRDFSEIIHFEIKLDELVKAMNQIEAQYDIFLCTFLR